uniref:SWIM-type domain-containing protein n=1 Tax=Phytophthora ramorum TaxID=164328 RepID=H3GJD5_PHYRM
MKDVARDWAAQGLRPLRVWHGLMRRFNLDDAATPPLVTVQRLVHNYVVGTLVGSDLLKSVRLKIRDAGYSGHEKDSSAFTFSWRNDTERRPIIGNGTDQDPFVVGITTKKLLQMPTAILGLSSGISMRQTQEQYTEVLSSLRRVYQLVTGKDMCVQYAMGDADLAQWAALQDAFSINSAFRFLMCFFHVAKKVYEKTRCLDSSVAAMVLRHLHELHFTSTETEFNKKLAEVKAEWSNWVQLVGFRAYIEKVWLNEKTFIAAIKRDVTMRRRFKVGTLVDQLMILCGGESVRAKPIATTTTFSDRLARRAKALTRDGLLYEKVFQRGRITSLLADAPSRTTTNSIRVMALPATRVFDVLERRSRENLPATAQLNSETARMDRLDMPPCGWEVDTEARTCPCRFNMKHGSCVHLLFALGAVGSIDATGRETLFYRGTNKRKRAQARTQPAGRPRANGHALHME